MKTINDKQLLRSIKLSIVVATIVTEVSAGVTYKQIFTNPLGNSYKATDNGGTLAAIDAYKDGIGVIVLDNIGQGIQIDNSAMNTLVYKYGEAAKESESTIVDEVMYGSGSTNTKDKQLVGNLTVDGASCNDQNAATQGETWLNGNCQGGVSTNGTICNDENAETLGDKWLNGVCIGYANGTACNDENAETLGDKWLNGFCIGYINGTTCNDGNAQTINDIYTDGVCVGTIVNIAGNGLTYDNCEGGLRTWDNAVAYCSSKGVGWKLPNQYQLNYASITNLVPRCSNSLHTWTSTFAGGTSYYYMYSAGLGSSYKTATHSVRCIK